MRTPVPRLLLLTLTLAIFGCGDSQETTTNSLDAEALSRGEELFKELCSECHPRSGRGDYLKRIPATLLTRRSQQELVEWIRGSDQHREMPNFIGLSTEQQEDLATYLLSQLPR